MDFILPDIGEGIVECEVVKWLVAEGDQVEEDQPVAEVMTDKALVEIPAKESGTVTRLYYQEGDVAKVHTPLFALTPIVSPNTSDAEPSDSTPAHSQISMNAAKAASSTMVSDSSSITPEHPIIENNPVPDSQFILPDIGEGIVECEVVEWHVQVGELFKEDQAIVDVLTDKAVVEIPSPSDGLMTKHFCAKGEIAAVHKPLFAFQPTVDSAGTPQSPVPTVKKPETRPQTSQTPGSPSAPEQAQSDAGQAHRAPAESSHSQRKGPIPASPAVRRLVREHSLDLSLIPGSGKDGRVLKEDVLHFLESPARAGNKEPGSTETGRATPGSAEEAPTAVSPAYQEDTRVEPIRGIRSVMAKRMQESASTIPHFTFGDEIDLTALITLKKRLQQSESLSGSKLTLMPFFMKALALAVQQYPLLNSRVNEECTEIHYQRHCNIGMAVDTPMGLLVPNIKHVEEKSLAEIASEIGRLTEAARQGQIQQADLKGGTISISNIGAIGGTYASPIISKPEVAIVAIGQTQRLPRFDAQDNVVARHIVSISWSGDHRIIDGGTMARFHNVWKGYLEAPETMLLGLR